MRHALSLVVAAAVATAAVRPLACQDSVSVVGSTSVRPILEQAIRQYKKLHPEAQLSLESGGSSAGVQAAGKGDARIGMVSRELKAKEKEQFPDLVEHRLGIDGLAVVVNKNNPVAGLTVAQLRDAFLGRYSNWKELGGPDLAIEVVSQTANHGTFDAMVEHLGLAGKAGEQADIVVLQDPKNKASRVQVKAADGTKACLGAAMARKGILTFASAGAANLQQQRGATIRVLPIDGTSPTDENLASGAYRLQRPLLLVTKGQPAGTTREFLDFIRGESGRKIVSSLDMLPAPVK